MMPYKVEWFDGPGSNRTPFKVYSGGLNVQASPEEVEVWEHVQALENEATDLYAKLEAVEKERDDLLAAPPKAKR
jgi:hypothetical protein